LSLCPWLQDAGGFAAAVPCSLEAQRPGGWEENCKPMRARLAPRYRGSVDFRPSPASDRQDIGKLPTDA